MNNRYNIAVAHDDGDENKITTRTTIIMPILITVSIITITNK